MMKKSKSLNINLSKSSTAFFNKGEKNILENIQIDKQEQDELRRDLIKENLKKMIEMKKMNKNKVGVTSLILACGLTGSSQARRQLEIKIQTRIELAKYGWLATIWQKTLKLFVSLIMKKDVEPGGIGRVFESGISGTIGLIRPE